VNGVLNLGSGQARSFEEMARAVFAAAGKPAQIDYTPMPPAIRDKYQYFTEAKMERLRAAGYVAPMTGLEDGITDYVQAYLATADHHR
jgi:ADP-L-glycero-D-manno-heptose 6-epimerase